MAWSTAPQSSAVALGLAEVAARPAVGLLEHPVAVITTRKAVAAHTLDRRCIRSPFRLRGPAGMATAWVPVSAPLSELAEPTGVSYRNHGYYASTHPGPAMRRQSAPRTSPGVDMTDRRPPALSLLGHEECTGHRKRRRFRLMTDATRILWTPGCLYCGADLNP